MYSIMLQILVFNYPLKLNVVEFVVKSLQCKIVQLKSQMNIMFIW